ncbi:B12-binding domain-containing protein [uncultured Tateyamaria sp.]|uniref:cobalamin B12-binding domain-containing protein n=1 Tax=Tateyamaria sp. 1078 TaxID=3417464 RepID=UPI00260FE4B0|nr:cobalamin B12-binding domain-containing protein [uncultured Tateyamaria sp.]
MASQVISVLCERQTSGPSGARQIVVDYLLRAVTSRNSFDASLVMEELRGYRLTIDSIIDLYIPQVATCMGELWTTSDLDFASVTVGALRLQALLSEASSALVHTAINTHTAPLALVVVSEGEQHFLGASVVAAQLRRLGCDVSLSIAEPPKQITNRVLYDQPDMVLMSCAQVAGLETIARNVKKIRRAIDPAPVIALGGAMRGDIEGIRKKTGVDLVTKSAKDVVGFYTKRHKALSRG